MVYKYLNCHETILKYLNSFTRFQCPFLVFLLLTFLDQCASLDKHFASYIYRDFSVTGITTELPLLWWLVRSPPHCKASLSVQKSAV